MHIPGYPWVLQDRDSLLDPEQLVDELPHDEQLLVRYCRPPHAVAEQVPQVPQDDHTMQKNKTKQNKKTHEKEINKYCLKFTESN